MSQLWGNHCSILCRCGLKVWFYTDNKYMFWMGFVVAVTRLQKKQWFWMFTIFQILFLWMLYTYSVQIKEATVQKEIDFTKKRSPP